MKTILISVNFIGLFLYQLFFGVIVTIDHNPPATLAPGESIEVSVTIHKSGISGPAQLRLYLSDGLTVEEVDNSGASFTLNEDNNAVFIWMGIPADETVTLVYKLTALPDASGLQTVSGKFAYIENDERTKFMIPESSITISGGDVVTNNTDTNNDIPADTTINNPIPEPDTTPTTAERSITDLGNNSYLINITISKGTQSGFARVKDDIPAGFDVEKNELDGSIFKFESGSATFVWYALPSEKTTIDVSYTLTANSVNTGDYDIQGVFSAEYLVSGNVAKNVIIPSKSLTVTSLVDNTTTDNTSTNNTATNNNSVTNIPSPQTGISFSVQIAAGHKSVSSDYFNKRHNYSGQVNNENVDEWIKYTVSSFNAYKDARNERVKLDAGYDFQGPFVCAHNNGVRITVQEALMIANQQWVK